MNDNNKNILCKEKALKWLDAKWKDRTCEVCSAKTWEIQDHVVTPIVFHNGTIVLSGQTTAYPQFIVICTNCANTKYFNASVMNILVESVTKEGVK